MKFKSKTNKILFKLFSVFSVLTFLFTVVTAESIYAMFSLMLCAGFIVAAWMCLDRKHASISLLSGLTLFIAIIQCIMYELHIKKSINDIMNVYYNSENIFEAHDCIVRMYYECV